MQVRLVALVPVLGLLLIGCSGGGGGTSPEPTLEPLPSPTATALAVPPSAQATTPQGAAAFARFYLEVLSEAFVSGDTTQLRAFSHPDCDGCGNFIKLTDADRAAGKRFEGGAFLVQTAEASESAPGDAVVDVQYSRQPSRTRDAKGDVVDQSDGRQRGFMQIRTVRQDGTWLARGIRFPDVPG